jgi:predicted dehydrogenase
VRSGGPSPVPGAAARTALAIALAAIESAETGKAVAL